MIILNVSFKVGQPFGWNRETIQYSPKVLLLRHYFREGLFLECAVKGKEHIVHSGQSQVRLSLKTAM